MLGPSVRCSFRLSIPKGNLRGTQERKLYQVSQKCTGYVATEHPRINNYLLHFIFGDK